MNDQGGWGRADSNGQGAGRDPGGGYGDGRDNMGGDRYGIDAGDRSWGWGGFGRGFQIGAKTGNPLGGLVGGLIGGAIGKEGSPAVNGGGWGNLGPSGQGNGGGWGNQGRSNEGNGNRWALYDDGGSGISKTSINGPSSRPTTSSTAGNSLFPSVYTDPVTGRLLYNSMSPGGTSNQSYSDQQMLDYLQGSNVASQNLAQQKDLLTRQIASIKAAGGDTSQYESELARLNSLGNQSVDANNPLLQYVNSGLNERVANQNLDNEVANSLRSMNESQAKRGLGVLNSPMTDQLRASLGLSTAQARNQNKQTAQDQAYKNRMGLMSYLKNSQNQDYQQEMGRTGIGLTLGDWENQRKIAELAAANQNSLASQNMNYLNNLRGDQNTNAWLGALGNVIGNIDWSGF